MSSNVAVIEQGAYRLTRRVPSNFVQSVRLVCEALGQEGYGVLTEIDVDGTLRQKLGVEMPRQVILGACHPALAHRALEAEPAIGLLLPCNVVVRETALGVSVEVMDPEAAFSAVQNSEIAEIAREARGKLLRVLGSLPH